jgi:Ca2+-binding RTX toxin-like protein
LLLPSNLDGLMFTVMSYNALEGDSDSGAYRYPTTPMYYDVVAMEALYGPSALTAGNDSYTYSSSGSYWETIADSGGYDRLTYNSTVGEYTYMDLRDGGYCQFGQAIEFYNVPLADETDYRTVWIGPSTVIEKAVGGPGNEDVVGNAANNDFQGLGGDDTLRGSTGNDKLDGGAGNDRIIGGAGKDALTGGLGVDLYVFDASPAAANADRVIGYSVKDDSILVDNADFKGLTAGKLGAARYYEGGNVDALTTGHGEKFMYDTDSGNLYYDTNGASAGGKVLIATVINAPNLSSAEIIVF